ncbi:MAG: 1-deoxy-D-xylulose-5-phosphate reductoisomerase [Candidatus Hydrogenedentes bacterium]|nr:1-deoxy-D-xylulose-5-phosphate reductoisomerase [Candidatus Hydrogenedentota bacterium]
MARRLTILGSTGSIGKSALRVVRDCPGEFEIVGLGANSNVDELARQIDEFKPARAALADAAAAARLQQQVPGTEIDCGPDSIADLAAVDVDLVLCGLVGAVGLPSILRALESGNRIALANKEPMVMAGRLIMSEARERGVRVLPVDSEHNAVFQLLEGRDLADLRRVYLTASGGPFYGRPRESLRDVKPEEAMKHPRWDMGAKISVDSATLMNKGLEIIEAMWLFDLPLETIEAIIHPQSLVHGLVEFKDGHILAHLGVTDMTLPIQFALTWPKRVESSMARLDLAAMGELSFAAPDFSEFPCLGHAMQAARQGGTAGAVLNAANEVAVAAFRQGRIPYLAIAEVVGEVLESSSYCEEYSLESILEVDAETRRLAEGVVQASGVTSL